MSTVPPVVIGQGVPTWITTDNIRGCTSHSRSAAGSHGPVWPSENPSYRFGHLCQRHLHDRAKSRRSADALLPLLRPRFAYVPSPARLWHAVAVDQLQALHLQVCSGSHRLLAIDATIQVSPVPSKYARCPNCRERELVLRARTHRPQPSQFRCRDKVWTV